MTTLAIGKHFILSITYWHFFCSHIIIKCTVLLHHYSTPLCHKDDKWIFFKLRPSVYSASGHDWLQDVFKKINPTPSIFFSLYINTWLTCIYIHIYSVIIYYQVHHEMPLLHTCPWNCIYFGKSYSIQIHSSLQKCSTTQKTRVWNAAHP